MSRLKRLIVEIHRHSLWQIVGIYLGGAWLAYEIIQGITEGRGLPEWLPALALVLLVIGLPFVVATAFVHEEAAPALAEPVTPEAEAAAIQAQAEARKEVIGRRRLLTWRNAGLSFLVALAVWGVVATGWLLFGERATPEEIDARKSIAVLPLENLSREEATEPFTDGIHDDILTHLSRIADLKVISRTSVVEYRDTRKNLRQIADELGVATILEGGVQRSGNRVRINVQLIDAETDEHLWAETYEEDLTAESVFAIQTAIARRIASALEAQLTPEESERIAARPTDNLEAYDYYLRGNHYFRRSYEEEDYRIAVRMFERAVELDPEFAVAWATLSAAHSGMYWERFDRIEDRLLQAERAVQEAFRLSPDLPEAHLALGYFYYWGHLDYGRALEEFEKALLGLPGSSPLFGGIGAVQRRQGRWEEAAANFIRAAELDPRNSREPHEVGGTYMAMRRYAEAMQYMDRAIALRPDWGHMYVDKALCHLLWRGDVDQAAQSLREIVRLNQFSANLFTRRSNVRIPFELFFEEYRDRLDRVVVSDFGADTLYYYFFKAEYLAFEGDDRAAQIYYDSARAVLESLSIARPDDPQIHTRLGRAYAGSGRRDEAMRAGRRAVELLPVTREALIGPYYVLNLAEISVIVGDYDTAIEALEQALSVPSFISVPLLRVDPLYDPLRDNPRFQALLAKYDQPAE